MTSFRLKVLSFIFSKVHFCDLLKNVFYCPDVMHYVRQSTLLGFFSEQVFFAAAGKLFLSFLGAFAKFLKVIISFAMSVFPPIRPSACKNSALTGRIFMKFGIWSVFENMLSKFKLYSDFTGKAGILHANQYTFLIISRSLLLIVRNVSQEVVQKSK